ncbi:hypothetical protein P879_07342 [Paragonimus westermani]|uniref:MICOS complex subunit n=1 Tax=Paragonimus westermani TaxID=34504 RepID=A0A8T0DHH5_9TREM|nr:hypothetical protein P879_07342 [Paragonimus westermani]
MRVKDLPIYSEFPEKDVEYRLELRTPNAVEAKLIDYIKPVRSSFQKWFCCFEKTTEDSLSRATLTSKCISYFVMIVCLALYEHVRDEPTILARSGFITVCGLGGLILGYRGGIARKILYTSLSTTLATAACYPDVTYKYGIQAWNLTKTTAASLRDDLFAKK